MLYIGDFKNILNINSTAQVYYCITVKYLYRAGAQLYKVPQYVYTLGLPLSHYVFFYFRSFGYQLGCITATASAQQPVEHVKNALHNIMTEWMPQSVWKSRTLG